MSSIPSEYLTEALDGFRSSHDLGARAIAQLTDEELMRTLGPGSNSIAVLVRHVRGNLISRWTDFLSTDGEKPDRDRDSEFEPGEVSREEVDRWWREGFAAAVGALEALRPNDLGRVVTIRGEPMSALHAIQRSLLHIAQHVGQIVLLAKHYRGEEWETLSIPRAK